MKFVKLITLLLTFCVMAFSSQERVKALGGNAGFWPEDDANVGVFPAMINNLDMVQVNGAGAGNGSVNVVWGEGTTWGFGFDGAGDTDGNDWVNLMWGNGTYGVGFSFGTSSNDDGLATGGDGVDGATSTMGLGVDFGMNMGFGELGVNFDMNSSDDGTNTPGGNSLKFNLRRGQDLWLFDNMLVSFGTSSSQNWSDEVNWDVTAEDGTVTSNTHSGVQLDGSNMNLGVDLFTNLPAGDGVTAMFALGFGYNSGSSMSDDQDCTTAEDGTETCEYTWVTNTTESSTMVLPAATLGVEADVTDWASVRFGMNHSYVLAGSEGEASWSGAGDFDWNFGLGFDYGSFTLDMVIGEDIFKNPVHYVTGRNDTPLTSSATLTWNF